MRLAISVRNLRRRDGDGPSAAARPPAALRAAMAPSGSGALRDRRTGRWPLSLLAGTRVRTLAALAYAASEPSPSRPHAELTFSNPLLSHGLPGLNAGLQLGAVGGKYCSLRLVS